MYCQASTGFFIVRRCRGRGINRCTRCQLVLCEEHFNRDVEKCLSCVAIEENISLEKETPLQEGSRQNRWGQDHFYYSRQTNSQAHETQATDTIPENAFSNEDFQAFEDIQHFDQDSDISQAYDS